MIINKHYSYAINVALTEITAVKNEVALIYHSVRGLYFLAVFFAATIVSVLSLA